MKTRRIYAKYDECKYLKNKRDKKVLLLYLLRNTPKFSDNKIIDKY